MTNKELRQCLMLFPDDAKMVTHWTTIDSKIVHEPIKDSDLEYDMADNEIQLRF